MKTLFMATIASREIPVHVYEAQLLYQSPSGFYAGPNLQCNLSRYPVDEANTLFADSYVLLGFRAGFRRPNGFSSLSIAGT